jgi:hypothetical protein
VGGLEPQVGIPQAGGRGQQTWQHSAGVDGGKGTWKPFWLIFFSSLADVGLEVLFCGLILLFFFGWLLHALCSFTFSGEDPGGVMLMDLILALFGITVLETVDTLDTCNKFATKSHNFRCFHMSPETPKINLVFPASRRHSPPTHPTSCRLTCNSRTYIWVVLSDNLVAPTAFILTPPTSHTGLHQFQDLNRPRSSIAPSSCFASLTSLSPGKA